MPVRDAVSIHFCHAASEHSIRLTTPILGNRKMPVNRIERRQKGVPTGTVEPNGAGWYVCHAFGSTVGPQEFSALDDVAAYLRANPRAGVRIEVVGFVETPFRFLQVEPLPVDGVSVVAWASRREGVARPQQRPGLPRRNHAAADSGTWLK